MVYKQGLYGQKYTWILTGASLYEHWVKDIKETDLPCARKNLYAATNYMITLNQFPLSTDNHTTLSGRTPAEYDTWINKLQVEANTTNLLTRNHPWIYDSVWALALGLNNSLKYLNGSKLEDFNYGRYDIKNSIAKGMDEVKFEGVSGHVSFNNGRRIGPAFIQLNIGDNRTNVGRFDSLTGNITWYINPTCLWPGYIIPKDGSKTITENVKSSIAAVTVIGLMASVGFIVAFGLLIFNITFRKNRHIKMSSPRINNLIICGGMIMYLSVYISIAEYMSLVDNGVLCMLSTWSTSIGFTIAFGALFSKTWRVHVLFHNNSIRKKVIKDVQLLAVCVVLLAVDIMILVPWTFFYSLERNKIVVLVEDENTDVSRQEVYYVCSSSTKIYWIGVQYVYKGLLLAFGTFLAWETRKIEVLALNDSKLIGFCVYNIVIICFIGVPIHHLLREDQVTMRFVLINCLVIFCTTLVLCILFIPKLKFRNETESIKFVASLKGKISTAVKNSTIKAIASKANIGNRTGGKDQIYRENESTQNEHIQEHSAYFEDRTLTPNKETRGTMHSFADETSTAV